MTSGDVTNDGKADIIASSGAGTESLIRVFSGANSASLASVRPFETSFTDGGKVAVVDADKDGLPGHRRCQWIGRQRSAGLRRADDDSPSPR